MDNPTPATKPQPVMILGSILAGLTAIVGGLTAILHDNETATLIIGIAGVVIAGVGVMLTTYTKGQTVPLVDTAAYLNDERVLVEGPATESPRSPRDEVAVVVNPNDIPGR